MFIKCYDLKFCDDEATVVIAKGAEILSVGVRKDFLLGRFFEIPYIIVKEEETNEKEELLIRRIPVKEAVEVKAWQLYLGIIAVDNGTSSYNVIAE